jgi:hypothetical protein
MFGIFDIIQDSGSCTDPFGRVLSSHLCSLPPAPVLLSNSKIVGIYRHEFEPWVGPVVAFRMAKTPEC